MKIQKLRIRGFRNINDITLEPNSRVNFIIGSNGQGKTSILEAIGYLANLRSFRGAKTDEVVQVGRENADVSCVAANEELSTELKVTFYSQQGQTSKTAFINNKAYRSSTHYLNQRFGSIELGFHAIAFNPADHELVRGEPAGRRNYLNRVLAAEDINYLKAVQRYQRLLEQRNAVLKAENVRLDVLRGFTKPLAQYAAIITTSRLEWLERLKKVLPEYACKIAPDQAKLDLFYSSSWLPEIAGLSIQNNKLASVHFSGHQERPSLELLESIYSEKLSSLEGVELKAGNTLAGPHRDEWLFFLGEQVLKTHGSQGEIRSALLALKLSEIELFRKKTGHRPLLLLDDFSSELDQKRRGFLLEFLSEFDLQVFVTTTEEPKSEMTIFRINKGHIE
jgi:DNA replication and repair protein RecF